MSASMQDIPEEITSVLALLAEQRRRMESLVASKPGYDSKLQKPLSELANALGSLSREARQWAAQVAETLSTATPEQKTEVAVAWLTSLPVGARVAAYGLLVNTERESFEKLPLSYDV